MLDCDHDWDLSVYSSTYILFHCMKCEAVLENTTIYLTQEEFDARIQT